MWEGLPWPFDVPFHLSVKFAVYLNRFEKVFRRGGYLQLRERIQRNYKQNVTKKACSSHHLMPLLRKQALLSTLSVEHRI